MMVVEISSLHTYPWYGLKRNVTYNFYDEMNSINTIDHLENLKLYIMKNGRWKRLILIWDNASFHH